jgi:hypothetical protein
LQALGGHFRRSVEWARGARTHNPRIKRPQHYDDCGLYQRLCPHRGPHQPHQPTMVDVISCHEPCHAASDRRGSSLLDGFAPAGERGSIERGASSTESACRRGKGLGAHARQGGGYPGGVLHLETDSHVDGNPAAQLDWPMYPAHSSRSPQARVQIRPVEDGRR